MYWISTVLWILETLSTAVLQFPGKGLACQLRRKRTSCRLYKSVTCSHWCAFQTAFLPRAFATSVFYINSRKMICFVTKNYKNILRDYLWLVQIGVIFLRLDKGLLDKPYCYMGQTKEMRLSTDAWSLFESSPRENKFGRNGFLLVIHFVIILLPPIHEPIEMFLRRALSTPSTSSTPPGDSQRTPQILGSWCVKRC